MAINPKYKPPKIGAGELRTPVSFLGYKPNDGPEPGEEVVENLFRCTCLAYNPSMKDLDILQAKDTKEGLTIKIRDLHQEYIPTNKHKVVIDDYRYKDKVWEIIDVAPDLENNSFVKIILGLIS